MALVGTISGSNGTSRSAVTGTLVVANVSSGFPQIPADPVDAVVYAQGSIVATNEIHASGNLKLMNSVGDEGGELFLNKPVTNTTINTGVTVDIYQNKLRFFESGSPNRGYYIDITAGANSAGTNFATTAVVGGSTGQVQFNDGGSFGGDTGFTYSKTTDAVSAANLFVTGAGDSLVTSGNIIVKDAGGNSTAVITALGDITGSNLRLTGDIAVVGGDLTTTVSAFNLINTNATTLNIGGAASTVNVGAASSVTALAGDLNIGNAGKARFGAAQNLTVLHNGNGAITNTSGQFLLVQQSLNNRLELQTSGTTAAGMVRVRNLGTGPTPPVRDLFEVRNDGTIMIGSASSGPTFLGSTTIMNDLFLASGIVAVSTDATNIQLVSSGNVTIKLDANNNGTGHFFSVQDFNNVSQFKVLETGDAEFQGNLTITGSVVATTTSGTFNFLNTTLTGTLNIAAAATTLNFGSSTSTGSFGGDLGVVGRIGIGGVVERMTHTQGGNTLTCDMIAQSIFYLNNPSGNVTANFTNVPTTNNRIHTPTVILSQSATPQIVNTVQIDGVGQTINWNNNVVPTGTANKQDVFGFSLIRSGSAWKVLGQMSTYG